MYELVWELYSIEEMSKFHQTWKWKEVRIKLKETKIIGQICDILKGWGHVG